MTEHLQDRLACREEAEQACQDIREDRVSGFYFDYEDVLGDVQRVRRTYLQCLDNAGVDVTQRDINHFNRWCHNLPLPRGGYGYYPDRHYPFSIDPYEPDRYRHNPPSNPRFRRDCLSSSIPGYCP